MKSSAFNVEIIQSYKFEKLLDPSAVSKKITLKRKTVPSVNLPIRKFDRVLAPTQIQIIEERANRAIQREAARKNVWLVVHKFVAENQIEKL